MTRSRAPELLRVDIGERIKPKELKRILIHADVYAFGLLISEILTGCSECYAYKGEKRRLLTTSTVCVLTLDSL